MQFPSRLTLNWWNLRERTTVVLGFSEALSLVIPSHVFPQVFCNNSSMTKFDRLTWDPHQMNGQPCVRGMRLTVRRVVEAVSIYPNREDLVRNYPELEPEDVRQALAFAAANLEDSAVETSAA